MLVVAHGNVLRALCVILDRLTDPEATTLDIPTAAPLRHDCTAELHPLTRGGVYLDPGTARARAALVAVEGRRCPHAPCRRA
ncbi:hypothetical protein ACWD64_35855 [Streptomyces antibioticus]